MSFMKQPCKHCPFRRDVKPYLHPNRAYEISCAAANPYNDFPCHKTTEYDENFDERVATNESKMCAGFLTLRAVETDRGLPEGFVPSFDLCYEAAWEMTDAYEEEWNKTK